MPTAVEHGDTYYSRAVEDGRGIPAKVANAVVAAGRGVSIGHGRLRYRHAWTAPTGQRCEIVVIAQASKILSAYVSFSAAAPEATLPRR